MNNSIIKFVVWKSGLKDYMYIPKRLRHSMIKEVQEFVLQKTNR
jgi:hypothetical protein